MGVSKYLMGGLEIFDRCPGYILWVSWLYLIGVLEIFECCHRDIWWVYFRYL